MSLAREEVSVGTVSPLRGYTRRCKNSRKQISLNKEDKGYINNLPDDILIRILSLLDTKAAISTSTLSKRWKHLYRSLSHFSLTLQNPNYRHDEKMSEFVRSIQNLVVPNTNSNIKSLFIELNYFRAKYKPLLDECVLNASNCKLKHFELLVNGCGIKYKFPLDSLDALGVSVQILHLSGCALLPHPGYLAFRSLKKLILTGVVFYDIEDYAEDWEEFQELIEERFHILINGCLNLEILSLIRCAFDGQLRIDVPFSRIKDIKYTDCFVGAIEIVSAPKLESLDIHNNIDFEDKVEPIPSKPIPSIKHLRFGFSYTVTTYRLDQISSILPCLETLVLCFEGEEVWLLPVRCAASFMKLKRLVIEARMPEICNPLWIALILEAAPFLETFEINIEKDKFRESSEEVGEEPEPFNFQHKNLKGFKVIGFDEGPMVKNLVRFVMESAPALEKIVLCNDEGYYEELDATKFSSIFE
ncbi:hypothetical protein LUZ60_006642 [Juncus effusus]|nr:hypothetical protein LUZ60_006642 [Juncus effusus]